MKKKSYDSRQSGDSQGSIHKAVKVPRVKIKSSAYGINVPENEVFPDRCIEKKLRRVGGPGDFRNKDLVDDIIDEQSADAARLRRSKSSKK